VVTLRDKLHDYYTGPRVLDLDWAARTERAAYLAGERTTYVYQVEWNGSAVVQLPDPRGAQGVESVLFTMSVK
jgi:hypothetical protein